VGRKGLSSQKPFKGKGPWKERSKQKPILKSRVYSPLCIFGKLSHWFCSLSLLTVPLKKGFFRATVSKTSVLTHPCGWGEKDSQIKSPLKERTLKGQISHPSGWGEKDSQVKSPLKEKALESPPKYWKKIITPNRFPFSLWFLNGIFVTNWLYWSFRQNLSNYHSWKAVPKSSVFKKIACFGATFNKR